MFPSLVFILGSRYIVRGRTMPTDWTLHPLTQIAQLHERSRTWRSVADLYHSTCKRQDRMRTVDWQKKPQTPCLGSERRGLRALAVLEYRKQKWTENRACPSKAVILNTVTSTANAAVSTFLFSIVSFFYWHCPPSYLLCSSFSLFSLTFFPNSSNPSQLIPYLDHLGICICFLLPLVYES